MSLVTSISPTRCYALICNKGNFDGHFVRTFYLPETDKHGRPLANNADVALGYFMRVLNMTQMPEVCLALEEFRDVEPEKQNADGSSRMFDFPKEGEPHLAARIFRGGEATIGMDVCGRLDRFAEEGTPRYGFEVRYRFDGSVSAAVVGNPPTKSVQVIPLRDKGVETRSSRHFVEARLQQQEQQSDGKWRFVFGSACLTLGFDGETLTVEYYYDKSRDEA